MRTVESSWAFLKRYPRASTRALPLLPEWSHQELLTYEKETLGFYVTGHPLSRFAGQLSLIANADTASIHEKNDKEEVAFCGVVSHIREVTTKKKDTMAYVTLEDLKGSITVIFFAEVYRKARPLLHGEEPVLIRGSVDVSEEGVKVIASDISTVISSIEKPPHAVHFTFHMLQLSAEVLEDFRKLLKEHPGKTDGFIHLLDDQCKTVVYLGEDGRLEASSILKKEADRILGEGSTQFI